MKKLLLITVTIFLICRAHAQNTQPYGVVDMADLELKDCSFEKGAGGMILFDKAEVHTDLDSVVMYRHIRLKIFNDGGKDLANVRLSYYSGDNWEKITLLDAQTIDLENGQIVRSKVDADQIFTENINKNRKALVFTFSKVKPGCIIEYRYKWKTISAFHFPVWYFQSAAPCRYSELTAILSKNTRYKILNRGTRPDIKDTASAKGGNKGTHTMVFAKKNVRTFVEEPFVTAGSVNLQCLIFTLQTVRTEDIDNHKVGKHWLNIALRLGYDSSFGVQLGFKLSKEDTIIAKAKTITDTVKRIAYLFDLVKNSMTWNNKDELYTDEGVRSAWRKKVGNATEINLILFRLLHLSGINAHPMVVSTRGNGEVNPELPNIYSFNKAVVYIPVDSAKCYVLDASSRYNVYNDVPLQQLNTWGMTIDREGMYVSYKLIFLKNQEPAQQVVLINGDIGADGKITGTAEIDNYSYNREYFMRLYNKLGEAKYTDILRDKSNMLNVKDLKFENMEADSLPMVQKFGFNLEHSASDGNYIYFDPNIFTPLRTNPFLSEERSSDIDLGHGNLYSINARYKLPAGFKTDALPKSTIMTMPDKSITFKRVIGEANGYIELHYTITQKRSNYTVAEYPPLREFYKKMYDMLKEPVVLKKAG